MLYLKSVLISVGFLLAAIPSVQSAPHSIIVSAMDLNDTCAAEATAAVCSAYISGFARGFYYASIATQAGYPPCIRAGVSDSDARTIVAKFFASHPEMLQQGAPSVIAEALVTAFPCRPRK
jgi:hypothetical protein